jgi:hypothetical protein
MLDRVSAVPAPEERRKADAERSRLYALTLIGIRSQLEKQFADVQADKLSELMGGFKEWRRCRGLWFSLQPVDGAAAPPRDLHSGDG